MDALRAGGKKVVGTKQVIRALKAGTVSRVYAASDADTFIYPEAWGAVVDFEAAAGLLR